MYFAEGNLRSDENVFENYMTKCYRSQVMARHPVSMAKFFDCLIRNVIDCLGKRNKNIDDK